MDNVATASINSFGIAPKASFELSYVNVPAAFLEELIGAIQGLKDEVQQLREERDQDRQEIAALRSKVASLESLQEQDTTRICLDIAYDRRRLAALEHPIKEPRKTETSRAEKIEKYLLSRPDHRTTFETLKGVLQVDNVRLNETIKILIATSDRSYVIQKEKTGDKRKRSLVMLPK